jgi:hypothetical protein
MVAALSNLRLLRILGELTARWRAAAREGGGPREHYGPGAGSER